MSPTYQPPGEPKRPNRAVVADLLRQVGDAVERRQYDRAREVMRELRRYRVGLVFAADLDTPPRPRSADGPGEGGR